MIQKINVAQTQNQIMNKNKKETPLTDSVKVEGNFTSFSKEACNALKAQISFAGSTNETTNGIEVGTVENEQSIKARFTGQNRVPDKFVFEGKKYDIVSNPIENGRSIEILNKNGEAIISGKISNNIDPNTQIEFNVAKHAPEIKIIKDDSTIQLFEGSSIKSTKDKFEFTYPGKYSYFNYGENKVASDKISFKGNYASLLCKKDASLKAINDAKNVPFVVAGKEWEKMAKDEPSVVTLTGGFGTRFANMTDANSNKPSFVMPNGQSLAGAAFDLAKNGQALKSLDSITYLNQVNEANPSLSANLVEDGDTVLDMPAFASDGGAVINSILEGNIPKDKPLVILNADTITNIDISQTYNKLKTLKNAALVIPCYPVSETRAKSFGLMEAGRLADEEGSRELTSFVEKPKFPGQDAQGAMIKGEYVNGEQAYRGNPGIYLFNDTVLQNLDLVLETASEIALQKKQVQASQAGKEIPTSLGAGEFSASTFLGNAFVPAVVKLCKEGRLKDKDGNEMKTYIVPMTTTTGEQAVWDDVGSAEAFVRNCQDIAYETESKGTSGKNKYYGIRGLEDFRESAIIEDGVIFASPSDKENFEAKHAQDYRIKGNVFIRSGN